MSFPGSLNLFKNIFTRYLPQAAVDAADATGIFIDILVIGRISCLVITMEGNGVRTLARRGDKYFWHGHYSLDFLTNGYESAFDVDGATFHSVSWYMWYMRAKMWRPNSDLAVLIREAKDQEEAKQLSRRCASAAPSLITAWMAVRLKIMARAVLRKFECSEELSSMLVSTGQDRLLYASKFDGVFGIGFTMVDAANREDEWGRNYLGDMLMLVRARLNERGTGG